MWLLFGRLKVGMERLGRGLRDEDGRLEREAESATGISDLVSLHVVMELRLLLWDDWSGGWNVDSVVGRWSRLAKLVTRRKRDGRSGQERGQRVDRLKLGADGSRKWHGCRRTNWCDRNWSRGASWDNRNWGRSDGGTRTSRTGRCDGASGDWSSGGPRRNCLNGHIWFGDVISGGFESYSGDVIDDFEMSGLVDVAILSLHVAQVVACLHLESSIGRFESVRVGAIIVDPVDLLQDGHRGGLGADVRHQQQCGEHEIFHRHLIGR